MKKYILLLSLLINTIVSFAQFPVVIGTQSDAYKDRQWMLNNEGGIFGGQGSNVTDYGALANTTVGTVFYSGGYTMPAGLFGMVNYITVTVTGTTPCYVSVNINRSSTIANSLERTNAPAPTFVNNQTVVIPMGMYLDEFGSIAISFRAASTTAAAGTSVQQPFVSFSIGGLVAGSDYNPTAKNDYLEFGDSESYTQLGTVGGLGVTNNSGTTAYGRRMVASLRAGGIDCRLVQEGVSGVKASQLVPYIINTGKYDANIKKAWIIEIALGKNDSADGIASATNYSANIQALIDYIYALNPTVSIILRSPYGTSVSPRQANLPSYRTALSAIVPLSKYTGKHLYYWNSFIQQPDPTGANDPTYTETATGSQLHSRGDTGGANLAAGGITAVQATYAYTHYKK